jgi:hypothetical protein
MYSTQVPGVIVMEVVSCEEGIMDPLYRRVVVVFNAAVTSFTGGHWIPTASSKPHDIA